MSAATQPVVPAVPRRTWSARVFSLPTVLGLLLVMLLFLFMSSGPGPSGAIVDPDIWWHLRDAAQLIHTGHFIRADSWTFTVAGKPWIDFEWLAELPWYFAFQKLGYRGIDFVMMLLASAILVGIYSLACLRSGDCKAAFIASFIGFHFVTVSMAPRTLLFGWFFLVVELAILWSLEKGRDCTLWLPPLFLLWINTHGSWLIGFVLMVLFFVCGAIQGDWGSLCATRWTSRQFRKFAAVTAASFAVLFINPYGWRLVAYPLDVAFHQKLTIQHVAEWASLDFHSIRGKTVLATFLLVAVLTLVRRRRWSLQDLLFALIAVYGAFTYERFLFLAGILIVPLLAMDLPNLLLSRYDAAKDRRWINAVAMAVLLAIIAFFVPAEKQLRAGVNQAFPEKALPYVRSLAGQGHLFNAFNWGAYLEWNAPQVPEFVDSRVDIFVHQGVLADYLQATEVHDTFAVLDKYQIRYVLLGNDSPMTYLLEHSSAWKQTYADRQAVAFERVR